nr:ThuA domain-containing protein [Acidobacteriota bacterium]
MTEHSERVDAYLVAGGKYHDIDFARGELLGLLAEHPHVRVTVAPDYEATTAITDSAFLISYTCDV